MRLTGRSILLTRPADRGGTLVTLLQSLGARVQRLPLLRIEPCGVDAVLRAELDAWRAARIWVFTSVYAARRTGALDAGPWPPQLAIGTATALALQALNRGEVRLPASSGQTSEALLADPVWDGIDGQRVLLCAGEGGRDAIAPTLLARGARVHKLALYRRVAEQHEGHILRTAMIDNDTVLCSSAEALRHLDKLIPQDLRRTARSRLLVVPSTRVLELARDLGYSDIRVPARFDDAGWAECLAPAPQVAGGHPASRRP